MDDVDDADSSRSLRVPGPPGLSRGTVLHVDDDEEARLVTGTFLKAAGFDAREASSPDSALEQARSIGHRLDVLIVDYHLKSQLTGTEVAESIARVLGHGVPTVILTGDPYNAEVPWIRNSPVWLVHKPVCPVTLVSGLWPLVAFCRAMKRLTPR